MVVSFLLFLFNILLDNLLFCDERRRSQGVNWYVHLSSSFSFEEISRNGKWGHKVAEGMG